jgi:hypothetical protein
VLKVECEGGYRTFFLSRITDGDDVAETLFEGLRDALRLLGGNVNTRFFHDLICQGVQGAWLYGRTRDIKPVTR